jgi:hypothetical protein
MNNTVNPGPENCLFDLSALGECGLYPYGYVVTPGPKKLIEPCLLLKFNKASYLNSTLKTNSGELMPQISSDFGHRLTIHNYQQKNVQWTEFAIFLNAVQNLGAIKRLFLQYGLILPWAGPTGPILT